MANRRVVSLRCPTCRTLVLQKEGNFPFCSDRCRLIDLGKWASGGYVISTPITDPEKFEAAQEERNSRRPDQTDSKSGDR